MCALRPTWIWLSHYTAANYVTPQIPPCLSACKNEQHAIVQSPPAPCTHTHIRTRTSRMLNMAAVAASELLDCVSWGTGKLSPGSP